MTHQGIRIRTDIFQSQEFALLKERADGLPLNMILPTPVPTIINDFFKPFDEPEGLRSGSGKGCWAAFDERRKKELRQARNLRRKNKSQKTKNKKLNPKNKSQKTKKKKQNPNNLILGVDKGIDFVNGRYSCSVCQIGLEKGQIHKHLKGLQHATYAAIKQKNEEESKLAKKPKRQSKKVKKLSECKQIDEPEVICLGNGKNWDYNDNRSSEDLPYPAVKDIQDEQSLEEFKKNMELLIQINKSLNTNNRLSIKSWQKLQNKGIDFVNGNFSCLVCKIGLGKGDIDSHLQGKRHLMVADPDAAKLKRHVKLEKKLNKCKEKVAKIAGIEFIVIKKFKDGNLKLICSLCHVEVTSVKSIKEHIRGQRHKLNYESFAKTV